MFFADFRDFIYETIDKAIKNEKLPPGLTMDSIAFDVPKKAQHGDISVNAAMVLAKQAKMSPESIAQIILPDLENHPCVESATLVKPGFINFIIHNYIWVHETQKALIEKEKFGSIDIGKEKSVNIEYISANPTGPMHIGHMRGAAYGDSLSSLLAFMGYNVTKEYYINDAGGQIDALTNSVLARCRELQGMKVDMNDYQYPGDYVIEISKKVLEKYGTDDNPKDPYDDRNYDEIKNFCIKEIMCMIMDDLESFNIHYDKLSSEKELQDSGAIESTIKDLEEKGLIYYGVLEPPKGIEPEDWEPNTQMLFRATKFGDTTDRTIKKNNGQWTYFASDMAYHKDKINRGYDMLINVFGADHEGYVPRITAAVNALSNNKTPLIVKTCHLVKLLKNGKPYKMSKRAGTFVTWKEVVDKIGSDIARFIMLTRRNNTPLEIDIDQVLEQSQNNPVFYVQYAHARICSVFRNAAKENIILDGEEYEGKLDLLDNSQDFALMKKIALWAKVTEQASLTFSPHVITFYLLDLATVVHGYWDHGKASKEMRFIQQDNKDLTLARLALLRATYFVLRSGLGILGVKPVDRM